MTAPASEVPEPQIPAPVPPDLPENERRIATLDRIEMRADGDKIVLNGHAAVFDRLSDDLGGFRERIQRGAFRKVLDKGTLDVRLLHNHDPNWTLARSTINTGPGLLDLREDPKGLRVYAELVPTSQAQDLRLMVSHGVVSQMSFGFRIGEEGRDVWDEVDGGLVRTIVSFGDLFDVSTVTYPAYQQTDAAMRSSVCGVKILNEEGGFAADVMRDLAWKIHRGEQVASEEDRSALDAAFASTGSVAPWVAERVFRAASSEPELLQAVHGKSAHLALEDAPSGQPADVPFRLAARRRRLRAIQQKTGGNA